MANVNSIKELCEELWDLEKKYSLLNEKVQGIYFWQGIRFKIFTILSEKTGLFGQAHTRKNGIIDKLKVLPMLIYNSIKNNPLHGKYQVDNIILDHKRKVKVNGKYIDIYTHYLLQDLEKIGESYEVIEYPYLNKHLLSDNNRKYSDIAILGSNLCKILGYVKLNDEEINFLKTLENEIIKRFNVDLNITKITKSYILSFKFYFKFYKRLLNKRKPKTVYLVSAYGNEHLIAAAKYLGIKTVEFQHGIISPYHIAYNYPHYREEIIYFPDKILLFGEYWEDTVKFPKNTETEIYGFPHLTIQAAKYSSTKKNKKQILFLSQGTIGKELSNFVLELAKYIKDYKIIYKLHPGEYDRWKNIYPNLVKASKLDNVTVVDHNNKDIYSYMAESTIVSGVHSTAIYEALYFNCRGILIDLPGIEDMKDLESKQFVTIVNSPEEYIEVLKSKDEIKYKKNYFFN